MKSTKEEADVSYVGHVRTWLPIHVELRRVEMGELQNRETKVRRGSRKGISGGRKQNMEQAETPGGRTSKRQDRRTWKFEGRNMVELNNREGHEGE